jgi:hypothetical protein
MRLIHTLAIIPLIPLVACGDSPPPPATQIIVQSPRTSQPASPIPPPAPLSEMVPPPPASNAPTVWQPGHWRYTGLANSPWNWQPGEYVAVPSGAAAWVAGKWQHEGNAWVWHDGNWAA